MDSDTDRTGRGGDESTLQRRIEAVAARMAGGDEPARAPDHGVTTSLAALRADLGEMRQDVGALRREVDTIRAHLDEVRRSTPLLTDAVEDSTASATERLDQIAGELRTAITSSVHAVSAELRDAIESGLSEAAARAQASEAGWTDTRGAVEERLAVMEDAVDGMAERFEALARNSAANAGEQLASLDDRLSRLVDSFEAERAAAQLHRDSGPAPSGTADAAATDTAAALEEWTAAVQAALADLGDAVERSLRALGDSLTEAAANGRDTQREHLESLVADIVNRVEEAVTTAGQQATAAARAAGPDAADLAALRESVEALHEATDQRLGELLNSLSQSQAASGEATAAELDAAVSRLADIGSSTRTRVEEELATLRDDLADALEEVRDRVCATVAESAESLRASGEEQRSGIESVVTAGTDRFDAVQEALDRFGGVVEELRGDWRPLAEAALADTRDAAEQVVTQLREQVNESLAGIVAALADQSDTVRGAIDVLDGGTGRLTAAGEALLGYLAERDLALERDRDRVLHEVLDEFAQGLSAKERRTLSGRVGEALDRRRDARDAERWRHKEAPPATAAAQPPAALTEAAAPVTPAPPAPPTARRTPVARPPAVPTAPAKRPPAAKPAKAATAGTTARASKKVAVASPPARSPAKRPAKKVGAALQPPAKRPAKKAATAAQPAVKQARKKTATAAQPPVKPPAKGTTRRGRAR